MNRWVWYQGSEGGHEEIFVQKGCVALYDGDEPKPRYNSGTASLTACRLIWVDSHDNSFRISLHHSMVSGVERHGRNLLLHRSPKLSLFLKPAPDDRHHGPVSRSTHNHIRVSFRDGGDEEFFKNYNMLLERKEWHRPGSVCSERSVQSARVGQRPAMRQMGGVGGVQRDMDKAHERSAMSIQHAFEDLNQLMVVARDMVTLSKNISEKLRHKQGDITEDETIAFKSYLLSLGVKDPVTKSTHGSGAAFYKELARELCQIMERPLSECGGVMLMSDVYCRVNRARGTELISPEDLLNACKALDSMDLPIKMHRFASSVCVLQLTAHGVDTTVPSTVEAVRTAGSLAAHELAEMAGVSVLLARERLVAAEEEAMLCRDESVAGLRFFPNTFLDPPDEPDDKGPPDNADNQCDEQDD